MRRGVWALLSSVGFAEVSPAQGAGAPGAGRRGGRAKVPPPAGFAARLPFHGPFLYSFSGFLSGLFPLRLPGPRGRPSLSVPGVPVTSSYSGIANRAQYVLPDGGKAAGGGRPI
jgi:hypothetical protein